MPHLKNEMKTTELGSTSCGTEQVTAMVIDQPATVHASLQHQSLVRKSSDTAGDSSSFSHLKYSRNIVYDLPPECHKVKVMSMAYSQPQ